METKKPILPKTRSFMINLKNTIKLTFFAFLLGQCSNTLSMNQSKKRRLLTVNGIPWRNIREPWKEYENESQNLLDYVKSKEKLKPQAILQPLKKENNNESFIAKLFAEIDEKNLCNTVFYEEFLDLITTKFKRIQDAKSVTECKNIKIEFHNKIKKFMAHSFFVGIDIFGKDSICLFLEKKYLFQNIEIAIYLAHDNEQLVFNPNFDEYEYKSRQQKEKYKNEIIKDIGQIKALHEYKNNIQKLNTFAFSLFSKLKNKQLCDTIVYTQNPY